jgi:predicted transcriptional regulator YdeE
METNQKELTEDIVTIGIVAPDFPDGVPATFTKLEQLIGGYKDRQVYGLAEPINGKLEYRACVNEAYEGEGKKYGLTNYIIPKGTYIVATIKNWQENIPLIGQTFDQLLQNPNVKENSIGVEDYFSEGEMLAMVQHK